MRKTYFFILFLPIIICFSQSSFGQNKTLHFTSWVFTWDSLCDNFPVQDYFVFFPNSIVVNYTVEDNICSMGKYYLQDSLVFMMFYCDETNFYFKTHPFDTIQYIAMIEGDKLLLREMGYWSDGEYKQSSYTIPENYFFKRKYSVY